MRELVREYGLFEKKLEIKYSDFIERIENETDRGDGLAPLSLRSRNKNLGDLLVAVKTETTNFGKRAATIVERAQQMEIEKQTAWATAFVPERDLS